MKITGVCVHCVYVCTRACSCVYVTIHMYMCVPLCACACAHVMCSSV